GERRVRMDGEADVGGFRTHFDRERDFGNQIARVYADDPAADYASRLLVEDQLRESFRAIHAQRTARRGPREFRHANVEFLVFRFAFGHADPRDFRIGVGDARNHARVERALVSRADFRRDFRLVRGLVRQHRRADDVADREDVRHVGAQLLVGGNETASGDGHAGFVRGDLVAVRRAADRTQHAIEQLGVKRILSFERDFDAALLRLGRSDFRLEINAGVAFGDALLQWAYQIGIGAGHQLIEQFHHGDFGTECVVHAGHFQADDAAADHQ